MTHFIHSRRPASGRARTHSRMLARVLTAFGAALLVGATACSDSTRPASAPLTVLLTDAPFPFEQVERVDVHVVRIDAKQVDASEEDANDAEDIGEVNDEPGTHHDGWITIATPDETVDLLDLQRGTTVNLGTLTIPTGTYRSFRLILDTDQSSVTLKDGTVLSGNSSPGIVFPSAGRTGIKVVLSEPVAVVENGSVVVLDFDLGQSFVQRGNELLQNGLLFKPVIRATARDVTGSISGSVRAVSDTGPVVANATVEVLRAGTALDDTVSANVITSAGTDSTGTFLVAFVLPGSYTLRATPPAGSGYAPAILASTVEVKTGETTTAPVIVVPAAP